jgi:hypothetical protein
VYHLVFLLNGISSMENIVNVWRLDRFMTWTTLYRLLTSIITHLIGFNEKNIVACYQDNIKYEIIIDYWHQPSHILLVLLKQLLLLLLHAIETTWSMKSLSNMVISKMAMRFINIPPFKFVSNFLHFFFLKMLHLPFLGFI